MGAIDYWIQAAKRPSCLMAVSPYQGGAWLSPMRTGVAMPQAITDPTLPTWAQRVKLLTYTNVRTDRGVFESVVQGTWSVLTQLDIRGSTSNYTFIGRLWCASADIAGKGGISLLYYGSPLAGYPDTEGLHITYWGYQKQLRAYIAPNSIIKTSVDSAGLLDRWIVVAMTINFLAGRMAVYADGALIGTKAIAATQLPDTTASQKRVVACGSIFASGAQNVSRADALLIFDYAMTAAEIAAFN